MGFLKSKAKIRINNIIIDYDEYNFEWSYEAKDDSTPSFLSLRIPNLAKNFMNSIKKGDPVIFDFGFDNNVGTLIQGRIDQKSFESSDLVTNYTVLKVIDIDGKIFGNVSKTYKNKNTEYIINDIANQLGLIVKQLDLTTNTSHINDYVAYGKGINIIKQLVNKNGSELKLEGDLIYIYREQDEVIKNPFLYNFETGLISEPSEYEEEGKEYTHVFKALANHELRKDNIVRIDSKDLKSYCKILKYSISNWKTEYYVKVLEV
jgi:hypothetical protein